MDLARRLRLGGWAVLWLLAAPAFAMPAGQGIQLQLQAPEEPLLIGEKGRLVVTLADAEGEPRAPGRDLTLQLETEDGLLVERQVPWPKDQSRLEVEIGSEVPGSWFVEAFGKGLFPASGLVVVVEPDESGVSTEAVAEAPAEVASESMDAPADDVIFEVPGETAPETPVLRRIDVPRIDRRVLSPQLLRQARLQNPTLLEALETRGPTSNPREGTLVLQPSRARVRRGADGLYRLRVKALWFVDGLPKKIDEALDLWFVFAPHSADRGTEPETVSISRGAVGADTEIRSRSPGEVQLSAMSERGISEPIEVTFLSPRPAGLAFSQPRYRMQSLAAASLDLSIQLRDEIGNAVVAGNDTEIVLSWSGNEGTGNQRLTIASDEFEVAAPIQLSRFGSYTVRVSAAELQPAEAAVEIDLDYLALLLALLGGIVGALARLLFVHRDDKWKKGIWRSLLLGAVAALLVLLLAVFQVLSTLEQWLPPELSVLGSLPFANHLAILLLGLVAGLGLESIILYFVGRKSHPAQEEASDNQEPAADEPSPDDEAPSVDPSPPVR